MKSGMILLAICAMAMSAVADDEVIIYDATTAIISPNNKEDLPYKSYIIRNNTRVRFGARGEGYIGTYVKDVTVTEDSMLAGITGGIAGSVLSASGAGGSSGGRGGKLGRAPVCGNDQDLSICAVSGSSGLAWYATYPTIPGREYPTTPGVGGSGGGAVALVAENLVLDGTIAVNGGPGGRPGRGVVTGYSDYVGSGGGGGSGGTIMLLVKNLAIGPTAWLTANGGDGGQGYNISAESHGHSGGAGGGGRIKIFYEQGNISPSAVMSASRGNTPYYWGDYEAENGSIYIQQVPSIEDLIEGPIADLNSDGKVDHLDLMVMLEQWQQTYPVNPTASPVSTPGGIRPITATPTNTRVVPSTWTPSPTKSYTPEVTQTETPGP